jgi:arsenate reductase
VLCPRDRLCLLRLRLVMADRVYNVLFLCTGNSARSIIAEAILNRDGKGRFHALSAGSHPKGEVNLHALNLLRRSSYDICGLRSKSWAELAHPAAPPLDFVFTVCDNAAGESCPLWSGRPVTAHWGIPDPAAATGNEAEIACAFDDAYRKLKRRIELFLALPIAKLDRLVLTSKLTEIGRSEDATAIGARQASQEAQACRSSNEI